MERLVIAFSLFIVVLGCSFGDEEPNQWDVKPRFQVEENPWPVYIDSKPRYLREVLVFTADWCERCQKDIARRKTLALEGVLFREINVDEDADIARKWKIDAVPTYIVLQERMEVRRTTDIAEIEARKEWLLGRILDD